MNTADAVKNVLLQSGATWVLWLLGALSLVNLAIIVERWLFYRTRNCNVSALVRSLRPQLEAGDVCAALAALTASESAAASIASAGLQFAARGPAAAERAMQSATALERARLERSLAYLGTLGNNAPFIGLFGTVVGVIAAFDELGRAAPVQTAATAASQVVMASIAEALVATAVGILVALPAVAAYNYFQRRVAALLGSTEAVSNLVLAYLSNSIASPG